MQSVLPSTASLVRALDGWDEITVAARTDRGRLRDRNQDAFLVADLSTGAAGLVPEVREHRVGSRGSLIAVSDGTGAGDAGEVASSFVLELLHRALAEGGAGEGPVERLRDAVRTTAARVWRHAQQHPDLRGFGATLTAVLVCGGAAHVAHVGDSRAYLLRGDRTRLLTRDHTLAQALLDSGGATATLPEAVPPHVLLHSFGPRPAVEFELATVEVAPGDRLLVCSDGLTNKVAPIELMRIVAEEGDPADACRRLVALANERGGEDNITVVLAYVGRPLRSVGVTTIVGG